MIDYKQGYEHYRKACDEYGLKPLHFHDFISTLTQQQLDAYNNTEHFTETYHYYEN